MKILLVSEYFPKSEDCEVRGGAEARCFFIAKELAKRHSVTVLTSWENGTPRESSFAGIRVLRCGKQRSYSQTGSFLARISFALEAIRIGKKMKAEIVDAQNFISYLPAYSIARSIGAKAVATYHDVWVGRWISNVGLVDGVLGEFWERLTLSKHWDHFIANSNFTKTNLIRAGIPPSKISVVHNGVDLSLHSKVRTRKSPSPTISCVARLVSYKRIDDLIKAIALLKKDFPNLRCEIVGAGPEEAKLKKLVSQLGLESSIDFLGTLPSYKEVLSVIKRSHILCLPSVVEGFGIVIVDAIACGVPYVAAAIPPILEVTENGKAGLLFNPADHKDLARKMKSLLLNKTLYARKVAESAALAKKYDWKTLAREVKSVYATILERKHF
ncbi:MAG: glycosyltransferase family 4 protein [Candidatus Woesearchaeota archaeon]